MRRRVVTVTSRGPTSPFVRNGCAGRYRVRYAKPRVILTILVCCARTFRDSGVINRGRNLLVCLLPQVQLKCCDDASLAPATAFGDAEIAVAVA